MDKRLKDEIDDTYAHYERLAEERRNARFKARLERIRSSLENEEVKAAQLRVLQEEYTGVEW